MGGHPHQTGLRQVVQREVAYVQRLNLGEPLQRRYQGRTRNALGAIRKCSSGLSIAGRYD